jgi:hypothetical protein
MLLMVSFALTAGVATAEGAEARSPQAAAPAKQVEVSPVAGPAQLPAQQVEATLKARLVKLGLSPKEASEKIAALTPADLQKLGENPDQVAMAGIKDTTLILIAVILVVPSLLLLLMI